MHVVFIVCYANGTWSHEEWSDFPWYVEDDDALVIHHFRETRESESHESWVHVGIHRIVRG